MATISPVLSRYHRLLFLVLWLCCWLLPPATPLMAMAADPAPRTAAERWRSFAPTMNEAAVNEAAVNEDAEVVYLDSNGFIRVWEPQPPTNESAVAWVSPEGGWRDLTLADVNGDGDLEILAVGGEAYTGRLVIYDPVLTEGAIVPDQIINTIPW
ncbi:MAG: VCBS repeat-containing protein, partial [Caldilineaceae bacterium]|nr:VCBS repeat-containing protein [Caldilineaceae bacterium]